MPLKELALAWKYHPVMSVLYGKDQLDEAINGDALTSIIANLDLHVVLEIITALKDNGRAVFVNIDAIHGLATDRGGVEYLRHLEVSGIVTTRRLLIPRIKELGLIAVQKVFITDRSNLPRTLNAVSSGTPDLVQLMPAPIIDRLSFTELKTFAPYIASGFVTQKTDVERALEYGALAVSSQNVHLWKKF